MVPAGKERKGKEGKGREREGKRREGRLSCDWFPKRWFGPFCFWFGVTPVFRLTTISLVSHPSGCPKTNLTFVNKSKVVTTQPPHFSFHLPLLFSPHPLFLPTMFGVPPPTHTPQIHAPTPRRPNAPKRPAFSSPLPRSRAQEPTRPEKVRIISVADGEPPVAYFLPPPVIPMSPAGDFEERSMSHPTVWPSLRVFIPGTPVIGDWIHPSQSTTRVETVAPVTPSPLSGTHCDTPVFWQESPQSPMGRADPHYRPRVSRKCTGGWNCDCDICGIRDD